MYTSADGSLIRRELFLQNNKRVTSDEVQQAEQEKKRNWKHPQGTLISGNEFWYHILKYPSFITNLIFVMIQTTFLETRTGKSLRNPEDSKNNNFTQSDANVTNNSEKIVRSPNELRQSLSTNRHFSES